ncbi:MAG: serine/threonine protein kinase [Deltaproteobacteria bacterium]|nr:serine/threonine protein kinase [Deltaproteobacteria bacterium]
MRRSPRAPFPPSPSARPVPTPELATTVLASGRPRPISRPAMGASNDFPESILGDRYRLVEKIGVGGMATVYKAEHKLLRRTVAVKLLLPELAIDKAMAHRFEREAVAAARLDHPNCVAIIDFGRAADGRLFLVMEYLDGAPLSSECGHGKRVHWTRAVEIARQVLRGLARAHDMGVVHRDLKTSNVMLVRHEGGQEVAKIIDFGIAKMCDGEPSPADSSTKSGIVIGTADFIAPERLAGLGESDPRSDLYSVGIMLYEMITGNRPFHADDPYDIVKRALSEAPVSPTGLAPDVRIPRELEAVILRALAKAPKDRFPSARDFLAALDPLAKRTQLAQVLADAPVSDDVLREPLPSAETTTGGLKKEELQPTPPFSDPHLAAFSLTAGQVPPSKWRRSLLVILCLLASLVAVLALTRTGADEGAIGHVPPLDASPVGTPDAAPMLPPDSGANTTPAPSEATKAKKPRKRPRPRSRPSGRDVPSPTQGKPSPSGSVGHF